MITNERPEKPRSISQNDLMWALLTDIAEQVEWPVNGRMQKMVKEDWKDVLSAGVLKEQRIAEGINGGFVMLGQRTSKMTKAQMSDLIEFIYWFCAEKGVHITAPTTYEAWAAQYRGQ